MSEEFKTRPRSPNFPYLTLSDALTKAQALYDSAKGSAVLLSDAASDWGLSPTSSSTLRYASALISYGLLGDEGTGDARRVRLTDAALRILGDSRPGVKEELLSSAALNPALLSEYYAKWGGERPKDSHAVSTLIFDSNFTERAAKTFLGVYDDALQYVTKSTRDNEEGHGEKIGGSAEQVKATSDAPSASSQADERDSSETQPIRATSLSGEIEWFRARVSRAVTVRIVTDGELDARMLRRLIAMLETQCEMMEDDF